MHHLWQYTGRPVRMSHRKWRESKQDPSRARSGNQPSCCLVSLHFPSDILSGRPVVNYPDSTQFQLCPTQRFPGEEMRIMKRYPGEDMRIMRRMSPEFDRLRIMKRFPGESMRIMKKRDVSSAMEVTKLHLSHGKERRQKNHECFGTRVFPSLFTSEDYSLANSYTLQET